MRVRWEGLLLLTAIGCAGGRPATTSVAMANEWVLLGQRLVNDGADHDIIRVTAGRGEFRRIHLSVQRYPVNFHRVVVRFGNGTSQEIALRSTIPAGGQTRVIDLTGTSRVIQSVEFWYDANTIKGRRAQIRLLAMR